MSDPEARRPAVSRSRPVSEWPTTRSERIPAGENPVCLCNNELLMHLPTVDCCGEAERHAWGAVLEKV
jgi:hypothetical protein